MKPLTAAEEAAVERVAAGDTDKRAGRYLGKEAVTVRDQINSARRKLGAKTRAHLVMLWVRTRI